jgi:dihydroorotate dehydrogenase
VLDIYPWIWPWLRRLEAERAHGLAIALARRGLLPPVPRFADPRLRVRIWGREFDNPLGLAAGFDKNAEAPAALLGLGFGFVEVGTATPRPQPGNPRPRIFRLLEDEALINRLGFNNHGLTAVAARLGHLRHTGPRGRIGANVGPNRDAADPAADCAAGVRALAPLVDYLVVNVSSPNTPGLRDLQQADALAGLIGRAQAARAETGAATPLLIKIAPDVTPGLLEAIAAVALERRIDGLIATNTTTARPGGLRSRQRSEAGGLSGRPLFARSTKVLAGLYRLTGGAIPLIGVGGVFSGADAYAKIRAGASLVQIYTALVYRGPFVAVRILEELSGRLAADGFASVAAAVGAGR